MSDEKKVLIVENDEDIRNIAGYILENEGYEVAGCAYTLDNLLAMTADLILPDEWVHQEEGPMLWKEIKAIEKLAHIPGHYFLDRCGYRTESHSVSSQWLCA